MIEKLPLSGFPYFHSKDVDQARDALAQVYADGELTPVGSAEEFSYQFNIAPVGRITLTAMDWGSGMDFRAPSLDECFDFSTMIQGSSEIRVGRETAHAGPNGGVVLSPTELLRIRWDQRIISLNAKIERETLESHLAAVSGREISAPLEFSPTISPSGDSAAIRRMIQLIATEIDQDGSILENRLVADRYSDALLTTVLYAQPHNYSELLSGSPESAPPSYVLHAEEYIETHCDEPITAQALATVVGVGLRTLYSGFRKHRGYTPIEFQRMIRLRRVRAALLAAAQWHLLWLLRW